jgi:hypothetical protein
MEATCYSEVSAYFQESMALYSRKETLHPENCVAVSSYLSQILLERKYPPFMKPKGSAIKYSHKVSVIK